MSKVRGGLQYHILCEVINYTDDGRLNMDDFPPDARCAKHETRLEKVTFIDWRLKVELNGSNVHYILS